MIVKKWSIYLEMLKEAGIDVELMQEPDPSPNIPLATCCGQILMDYVDGSLTCFICGHVKENEKQYVLDDSGYGKSLYPGHVSQMGSQSCMYFEKKRFYKPVTHFKEHLRRYMGARFTVLPEDMMTKLKAMQLDMMDRDAYLHVRQALKHLKYSKYYKEIFTIIYILGGVKPKLSDQIYHQCIHVFTKLMQSFERLKLEMKRHSMPSNYVCLDKLLRHFDHEPYYNMPTLKDQRLLQQAEEMIGKLCQNSSEF
jgi:hypothetical protein